MNALQHKSKVWGALTALALVATVVPGVAQAGEGKAKAVAGGKAKASADDKSDKSDKSKDPAESKPAVKLDSSKLHSQLRSGDEEQMLEALTAIAENRGTDLAP
ncbi:MAG TPA: hypothetical protein VL137_16820, partial [Polyangiaceae bacterium]|nr:hypothetical protein [Polyangiaceae bacterium]